MTPTIPTSRLDWRQPAAKSIHHLYPGSFSLAPLNLVTIMQDLWYLLLIVIFAALIFGLTYGCAALGVKK